MAEDVTGLPAVDAVLDSVVRVWVDGKRIGSGVVTPLGLLTCYHVVSDECKYGATTNSQSKIPLDEIIATDEDGDLTLIGLERDYSPRANLALGLTAEAIVFLAGYTHSGRLLVARAKIEETTRDLVFCSCAGLSGKDTSGISGGAIFNESGNLCAINQARLGGDFIGIRVNHKFASRPVKQMRE